MSLFEPEQPPDSSNHGAARSPPADKGGQQVAGFEGGRLVLGAGGGVDQPLSSEIRHDSYHTLYTSSW